MPEAEDSEEHMHFVGIVVCSKCNHSNTFIAFHLDNILYLACARCGHIHNTKRKWKGKNWNV